MAHREKLKGTLADDIRASFLEARDYFAGKPNKAIVRRVVPSASAAREARIKLGLSARGTRDLRNA